MDRSLLCMVQADVLDKDIMAHLRGKRKGKRRGNEKISAWEELRKEVPPKTFIKSAVCD